MWYYLSSEQKNGPLSLDEIKEKVSRGDLPPDTKVWREGMVGWKNLDEVEPDEMSKPTSSMRASDTSSEIGSFQTPKIIAPHGYAGFWRRVFAYLVDLIVLVVIQTVLYAIELMLAAGVAQTLSFMVTFLFGWLYFALFESSSYQATPGKIALEIKVCDIHGQPISFARATGRHFGKILSGLILYIGFIMIAFTKRKQGLHDMIAECLVIKAPEEDED